MEIKVKKLNDKAVVPFKKYDSDFGYDCVAVSEEEIAPNVWKYGLGLAFEMERGNEVVAIGEPCGDLGRSMTAFDLSKSPIKLSIDARPRSSVWKTGMVLSNCEGTIDELYRGETSAVFYHLMPDMPRYKVGDRVCQIKLGITFPMEFKVVNELSETERGKNGYGSTGR